MNIIIVEDEMAAAKQLQRRLSSFDESIDASVILSSVEESITWFQSNQTPDLIFMDIQLEDGQSFEILESVEIHSPIIFTTAYDEFAIQAFRYNSIDYLLKPYKEDDLFRALNKFKKQSKPSVNLQSNYANLIEAFMNKDAGFQSRILVQIGTQYHSIDINNIAYFYTQHKIVYLVTFENKKYPTDQNLDQLEKSLNPKHFFRINRQFIIGIESIDKMYSYSKSRVRLILRPPSTDEIVVSTIRSPEFKKWLAGK